MKVMYILEFVTVNVYVSLRQIAIIVVLPVSVVLHSLIRVMVHDPKVPGNTPAELVHVCE